MSVRKKLLGLISAAIIFSTAHAGVLPVGQAEYEFIYDRMERADALSLDRFDWQLAPYRFDTAKFSVAPFASLTSLRDQTVEVFSFIGEDFRASKNIRATGHESLRGGVAGQPVDKLFLYGAFVVDEALADDPNYTGKKWRGLAGDVQEAFAHFHSEKFDLTAGRFSSFWGVRNSLIFSPTQRLDGFGYSFRWGRLAISYRLATLDGRSPDTDSVTQFENRYFAAHRFDFHFSDRLRVGLFETVLFGGPGRQIDLFYLNPILFYHGSQLNDGSNDNTTVGFDFDYKPLLGWKLYGQLMIDDVQIDNEDQADKEPAEIGLVVGTYVADFMSNFDIKAEYSRVTNRTFNQRLERNRYTHDGELIGSALGNDYDLMSLTVKHWFSDMTALSLHGAYYRQGEGRVDADWTEPWATAEGDYSEPFPTGTVERTATGSVRLQTFLFDLAYVDLETGIDQVANFGHVDGDDRTLPFVRVRLSSFLSTSINLD